MRIKTERLVLSLYEPADHDDFVRLLTDPLVMQFVENGTLSTPQADVLWNRLMKDWYPSGVDTIWKIVDPNGRRYLGNASVRPRPDRPKDWEIGYYLMPDAWGRGYATEVARRLVRYSFETLGLEEIFATVYPANFASRRVLEKAGLRFYRREKGTQGEFDVFRLESPVKS